MHIVGSILFQITHPGATKWIAQQQCPYGSSSHSVCSIGGRHPFPSGKQLCATPPNSSAPTEVLYCKPMEPRSNGTKRKAQQQFSHVPYDCCCSKNSSLIKSSPMYRKQLFCTNNSSYRAATYLGVHANWQPNHSQQRSAGSN